MAIVEIYDQPGLIAHVLEVRGGIVCVLTPAAQHDPAVQAVVRQLLQSQGIDCRACGGCPVGQLGR